MDDIKVKRIDLNDPSDNQGSSVGVLTNQTHVQAYPVFSPKHNSNLIAYSGGSSAASGVTHQQRGYASGMLLSHQTGTGLGDQNVDLINNSASERNIISENDDLVETEKNR